MAVTFVFDSERAPLAELTGAVAVPCPQCGRPLMSNSTINFGLVEVDGEVRAVPMLVQPSDRFECERGHVMIRKDHWRTAIENAADELSDQWSREVDPAGDEWRRNLRWLPERPEDVESPDDIA